MRVLMLTDFYHPVVGGLERYVQLLSEGLQDRGHEVEVACLRAPGSPPVERVSGVRVHRLTGWSRVLRRTYADPMRPYHPPVSDPGVAAQLRGLVDRVRPDLVNAHSWILFSQLGATDPHGPPLVVTLHDYGLACPRRDYLHHGTVCSGPGFAKCVGCAADVQGAAKAAAVTTALRISRRGLGRVARYIANSRATAAVNKAVVAAGVPMDVIPPFVPDDLGARARAAGRPGFLPPQDGYVLFVGVPAAYKGLDVLRAARPRMRNRAPLVVIGTRPAAPGPPSPTADTGLAPVLVTGVPHEQVLAAFRHCAVAVVPSVWQEPFGMVAVEAAACGAPVVASDTGGLKDIVLPEVTGLLVPSGDAPALGAAVDRLLDDPEARARMGAAAVERSRHFSARTVLPRVEQAYRAALRT